jgi:protein-disulfide isomerase
VGSSAGGAATRDKVVRYVRERFGVPETVKLTLGPFRDSPEPGLYEATLTADDGKQKKDQNILISKDGHFLIVGEMFNLASDPKQSALRAMTIQNQPAQGPANAPVTIVEYADLQCPTCARLHEFLEKDLVPKYGGKVRVVFKDFPLVAIHDWSMAAAIASQCAYQINPDAYVAYRSLIFQQQVSINASNSRDMLLNLAAQAGVDSLKLASCLDARASLPRVEQDMREGEKLNISSTPTSFVNGRMLVGVPAPDAFYKAIDEALQGAH